MKPRFSARSAVASLASAATLFTLAINASPSYALPSVYWENSVLNSPSNEDSNKVKPVRKESKIIAQPVRVARAVPADNGFFPAVPPSRPDKATAADKARKILDLVNGERTRRSLHPLTWDEKLSQAAENHSEDMVRRNYFSHSSPDGGNVMERVVAVGAEWSRLGENLASDVSVQSAHTSLMNSPGHRENLLKSDYGRIGIGVVSFEGQVMVTQVFAD